MHPHIKKKVYKLMHPELGNTTWDRLVNGFLIVLILLNVIAVIIETVQPIYHRYERLFFYFDLFSIIIFSIEYVLRVWTCTEEPRYRHPFFGRIQYMLSLGAIIDLLAILPFYIHIVASFDLRVLRILRLLRLFRVYRLTAYMKSTRLIVNVFKSRLNELLLSLILLFFLLIISSSLIYFVEHTAQPTQFTSIPDTLWWSIITLTTVGYGDMVPTTGIGKVLTGVILLSGVALFALPAGIITAGFLEESRKAKKHTHIKCPHCGELVDVDAHNGH